MHSRPDDSRLFDFTRPRDDSRFTLSHACHIHPDASPH